AVNASNQIVGTDPSGNAFLGTPCDATIGFSSQTVTAAGATISVPVTTGSTCTVSIGAVGQSTSFIQPVTQSMTGSGTFTLTVLPNTTSMTDRTGTLFIAGKPFTVTEAGTVCNATFASATGTAATAGGAGTVIINAPTGCSWAVTSSAPWLQLSTS